MICKYLLSEDKEENGMSKVIELRDYKTTKQREFFINFYHFLNRNLNGKFENLLQNCNHELVNLLVKNNYDPIYISYFQIPIVTFMVTVFIRNSDLLAYFPEIIELNNDINKGLFKENIIKIIERIIDENDEAKIHNTKCFHGLDETIQNIFVDIMTCIPKKILFL